jgi:hypothetical protein
VSADYFWGTRKVLLLAILLGVPLILTALVSPGAPAFLGAAIVFVAAFIVGPRIDRWSKIGLLSLSLGMEVAVIMVADALLRPGKWDTRFLAWRPSDALLSGALFMVPSFLGCIVGWGLGRLSARRPVLRDRLQCTACACSLIGHDTGRCPNCGAELSFEAMGMSPVRFRQLCSELENGTIERRRKRRLLIPIYLITAAAGTAGTAAWLLSRPFFYEPPPSAATQSSKALDLALALLEKQNPDDKDYNLGNGVVLTRHRRFRQYGWPREWLQYWHVTWTATRDNQVASVNDEYITDWIARRQKKQHKYWQKRLSEGEEWKVPFRLWKLVTEEDYTTFPEGRSWEIHWVALYANVLLAATVWFSPLILHTLRNVYVRLGEDARISWLSGQGRCVGCGYDLRGSLDSRRCPECGTPFSLESLQSGE